MAQTFPDDDDLLDAEMEALLNDDDGVFESKTPILFSTSQGTPGQTQGEGLVDAKGERKEEEENEIGKGEEPFSEGEGDVDVDEEEEYEEEEEEEDDDDDDEGTLETSLSLRAVSQEWEAFSLSTKRATWDSQALSITQGTSEAQDGRKQLAALTKEFKALSSQKKAQQMPTFIKKYQKEIDRLTKLAKETRESFLNLYKELGNIPDPAPYLKIAEKEVGSRKKVEKLEIHNERLEREVGDLTKELEQTRRESVEAQKMKEAHSATRFNQLLTEKIHQKEKALEQKYWETHQNFLKKEKKLQEQIYNQTHELGELKRERGERDGEVEELRGEKEEREREWRREVGVLREEVERERGKERELKVVLENLEKEVEEGKKKGGEWERERTRLVGEVGEVKGELGELEKRMGRERGEWARERGRLEKEVEELKEREREKETGGVDSITLRDQLKEKEQIIATQKNEIRTQKQKQHHLMKLVKQLEGDLSRSSASIFGNSLPTDKKKEKNNFLSDTFEVVVADDFDDVPLSSTSTSASSSDIENLSIMRSEKNRFERQAKELEQQVKTTLRLLDDVREENDSIRKDNVELYEKILFFQKNSSIRDDSPDLLELKGKYQKDYEKNLSPFAQFHQQSRKKRLEEMSKLDKLAYQATSFFYQNESARTILAVYAAFLHLFTFLTTFACVAGKD